MKQAEIKARITYWQGVYDKLQQAYIALIEGGVQSYTIDDRRLERFDLAEIGKRMDDAERKVDELTALLEGRKARKAFGIVPRDW